MQHLGTADTAPKRTSGKNRGRHRVVGPKLSTEGGDDGRESPKKRRRILRIADNVAVEEGDVVGDGSEGSPIDLTCGESLPAWDVEERPPGWQEPFPIESLPFAYGYGANPDQVTATITDVRDILLRRSLGNESEN